MAIAQRGQAGKTQTAIAAVFAFGSSSLFDLTKQKMPGSNDLGIF